MDTEREWTDEEMALWYEENRRLAVEELSELPNHKLVELFPFAVEDILG